MRAVKIRIGVFCWKRRKNNRFCEKSWWNLWWFRENPLPLHSQFRNEYARNFGVWCNGNTTDSGPVIPGSSPGIPTREHLSFRKMLFSYIYLLGIGENFAFYYLLQKKRGCVVELWHTLLFDFDKIFYLFSASIALIFSFTSFKSSLSFSTLRFISSTRLLPFLLAALRKPRLFS